MTQYIDKSALVSEIERWVELLTNEKNQEGASQIDKLSLGGRIAELQEVRVFLDTLEVKDVDSRLTLEDISILRQIMFDYNRQVRNEMSIPNNEDYCKEVLKRFKAQNGEKKD